MKINISSVLKNEGGRLSVNKELPVGVLLYLGNSFDFEKPLLLKAEIRNIGGALELKGSLRGEYKTLCDRCAAPVSGVLETEIDENLDFDGDGETGIDGECFSLSGNILDISGLIDALIWSNLPMKVLCREDCKGLCGVCGCNLNETVCNCDAGVYDPRLAILRELAKESEESE